MTKKNFNEYRFGDLNLRSWSNKYNTMERVNDDETKIVVKVSNAHILPTKYGYGLILDRNHVVWLKDWQVEKNWFTMDLGASEVLLTKQYFNVKEWGEFDEFEENEEELSWEAWLNAAKEQKEAKNQVYWSKAD